MFLVESFVCVCMCDFGRRKSAVLQTISFPYIPFNYFPVSLHFPSPQHAHTHTPLWVKIIMTTNIVLCLCPAIWVCEHLSLFSRCLLAWGSVFLNLFHTITAQREITLFFSLILLQRPVFFRVELRKKSSRKAKWT